MKLFLIDKNFYPVIKPVLNAVYIAPNFFGNKDYHIFFIKSSTFNIFPLKDLSFEVNKEHLTWSKYTFNFAKNITEQLNKITENIKKYEDIVFIVPNIYAYRASIQIFLKYFNLNRVNVIFENDLKGKNLLSKIQSYKTVEKGIEDNIVRKEFILKTLDRITYNFFMQKTPLQYRVNLSTLVLDYYFKNKKSKNILKGSSEKGEIFAYMLFNKDNIFDISNKYIFMDILFNDVYADPNVMNSINETYDDCKECSIVNFNGNSYLVKNGIIHFEFMEYSKPKLEEGFIFVRDYFTFDDISYQLTERIYENSVLSEDLEVLSYDAIPINFNILEYLKKVLSIEDDDKLIKELNLYKNRLENLFEYKKFKYIFKCPNCMEGKIYENDYVYFCNNCDFRFLKQNRSYNIKVNKRLFTLLMKYKIIEIFYKGEIRKVKLVKGKNGWYNLRMLKK
jgi:hypothetical protein